MNNNEIEKLISDYYSVLPDSKQEEFGKVRIIEKFEEFVDNERILQFFLNVLIDDEDFDLARVEIAKILDIRDSENAVENQEIAQSLIHVLKNSEDDYLVRQYVAMAMWNYVDVEGVFEFASGIILDSDEDINVRYNVLDIFFQDGATERTLKILKGLLQDEDKSLQQTANRILKEWDIKIED